MNSHNEHTLLVSGKLSIDAATGQVHSGADSIRLGPINMKVLVLLLESGNRVVTRNEFFDRVWKQQLVSDDVLTRSISDLRTLLGTRTDVPVLIETIPKRGYRWVPPVETAAAVESLPITPVHFSEPLILPEPIAAPAPRAQFKHMRLLYWGAVVLAGFALLSSLVLWIAGNYSVSNRVKVALLPIQADSAAHQQLATQLDRMLEQQMLHSAQFELLSFSATSLHLQNPFPVLAREYEVDYVLEGRIQTWQLQSTVTLNLVDARSASVIGSFAAEINEASDVSALSETITAEFTRRLPEP